MNEPAPVSNGHPAAKHCRPKRQRNEGRAPLRGSKGRARGLWRQLDLFLAE